MGISVLQISLLRFYKTITVSFRFKEAPFFFLKLKIFDLRKI